MGPSEKKGYKKQSRGQLRVQGLGPHCLGSNPGSTSCPINLVQTGQHLGYSFIICKMGIIEYLRVLLSVLNG